MLEVLMEEKEEVLQRGLSDVWVGNTVKLNEYEHISNPVFAGLLIFLDEAQQFLSLFYLPEFLRPFLPFNFLIQYIVLLQQGHKHFQFLIESPRVISQFATKIKSKVFLQLHVNGESANILVLIDEMQWHDLHIGEDEGVGLVGWGSESAPTSWLLEEGRVLADGGGLQGSRYGALFRGLGVLRLEFVVALCFEGGGSVGSEAEGVRSVVVGNC